MDSSQRISLPSLLSWVFLIIASSVFPTCPSSASRIDLFPNSQSHKVSVALYYETLCPFCSNFIVNDLIQLFKDGLIDMVDLKLVPYGNARIGPNNTIIRQHGPYECLLNTVEACAIDAWPELNDHFPFIYCVESFVYERKYLQWESCFEKLGLVQKTISDCYSSGYGKELELQYAAETNALQPPHQYVPWVVVDGQPLYEDYENFISYICKAYKGTTVLEACSDLSRNTAHRVKVKPAHSVCHKETMTSTLSTRIRSAVISRMRKINMSASM